MADPAHSRSYMRGGEFILPMALMISLVALSIDAMLPALQLIGSDLGVADANRPQLVVSALFVGLALGQLVYGPLSDSVGRKPAVYAGYALFLAGSAVCITAQSFDAMLAGRVLQGLGVAGPRVLTVALVRDQFSGPAMARIMSFIMAVFIVVPALAPALGQGILYVAGWRPIFGVLIAVAMVSLIWFWWRHPETLSPAHRLPFSAGRLFGSLREVLTHRRVMGYVIATGCIFSPFVGYLSSAQQVFADCYDAGESFALWFAVLALSLGAASIMNARLVVRYGMARISMIAVSALSVMSLLFAAYALNAGGNPPFELFIGYFMAAFFCIGLLFGNLNALAMEPLGHIAGTAASVVGALPNLMSIPAGVLIGQLFDGTSFPLVAGFAAFSVATLAAMRWAGSQPA